MKKKLTYRTVFTVIILITISIVAASLTFINKNEVRISQKCNEIEHTVNNKVSTDAVLFTDGQKHSVSLEEIKLTNFPDDSIPSLSNPDFDSIDSISDIDKEIYGIGVVVDGEARFYPFSILLWHNVVNDCIQGIPIVVTYCPLCQTGLVHKRIVGSEILDFRVSGKFWLENLLIFDEQSNSLWSTVLGEAIKGDYSTTILDQMPSNVTTLKYWAKFHPNTLVLSKDTGFKRPYDAIIDFSNISDKSDLDYLNEFVVIDNNNYQIMYALKKEGEITTYQDTSIYFNESKIDVVISNKSQDELLVVPRYIWESIFPQAELIY